MRLFLILAFTVLLSGCAARHDDGMGDLWLGVREVIRQ